MEFAWTPVAISKSTVVAKSADVNATCAVVNIEFMQP